MVEYHCSELFLIITLLFYKNILSIEEGANTQAMLASIPVKTFDMFNGRYNDEFGNALDLLHSQKMKLRLQGCGK